MLRRCMALLLMLFLLLPPAFAEEKLPLSAVNADDTFTVYLKQKYHVIAADGADKYLYRVQQGSCTDGRYYYIIKENQKVHDCSVWKLDLETWEPVDIAFSLPLGHGNDMTYNPVTNELLAVHYKPERNRITRLDPDTLQVLGTLEMPYESFCIGYCRERDQYIIGVADTYQFYITDSEFHVLSYHYGLDTGLITQGVDCDENYIYFPMNSKDKKTVVILVYDWDGNYVNTLKLGIFREIESMSHDGDTWYIAFNDFGSWVYTATMTEKEGKTVYPWEK
ncbi:MAG: hypothetical protein MJ136_02260 [Clostridia bacterium]|nr:hypothetical protein [Clostridia bacterium]